MKAKRLGRWATRLYILLLFISFVVFFLYIVVRPQISTAVFDKPSFDLYNVLKQENGDKLECSCSNISSVYRGLVTLEPLFYEVTRKY